MTLNVSNPNLKCLFLAYAYPYLQKSVRNLKILTPQFLFHRSSSFSNSRIVSNNHLSEWSQTWSISSSNRRMCPKNVKIDRSNETSQKTAFSDLHISFSNSFVLIIIHVSIFDFFIAINFISFVFFYHQCHSSAKWKSREQRFVH